jgi:tetratricopeptide (TPR) repeat protein
MGWVFVGLGEYEQALIHYKRSLRLAQELGDRAGIGSKLGSIGLTYCDLGDFQRARKYLDKAIELHRALGDQTGLADAYVSLAQTWMKEDRGDLARPLLDEGLKLARESNNRYQEVRALIYLALCRLASGDSPAEVLEIAESATRLSKDAQIANGEVYGLMTEALAHLKVGDPARGFQRSQAAVAILDAGLTVDGPEEVFQTNALLARALGNEALANEMLRRALGEVQRKARRLRDEGWRARFLAAAPARDIVAAAHAAGVREPEVAGV